MTDPMPQSPAAPPGELDGAQKSTLNALDFIADKTTKESKKQAAAVLTMWAAPVAGIAALGACVVAVYFGVPLSPEQCLGFAEKAMLAVTGVGGGTVVTHAIKDLAQAYVARAGVNGEGAK